ncbi:hypothetical protein PANO111632_15760 [Paracoccus nototheniae]|uniref:ABC-2 type transporter domain-containing protein n=1 Tax=Paracoccus nototheniae TaxID=2489002 RepID=A0ABW4DRX9_9RHOB|nr:hypothetical protein [Paracoccus nototheniae]
MIDIIKARLHDSTLLRTLFYLRIKSPFSKRYNYIYPLIATSSLIAFLFFAPISVGYWRDGGFFPKLAPLLSILFPFYIASLAAVSTFSGSTEIDKTFPEDSRGRSVYLPMRGKMGEIELIEITQRHFLSLLFGYCCIVSLVLLFVASLSSLVSVGIPIEGVKTRWWFSNITFGVFLFLFFQMLTLTLFAVYYLSDKIHRTSSVTGNEVLKSTDAPPDDKE